MSETAAGQTSSSLDSPAWRSSRAWALLLIITTFGLVTDLGSKWAAFEGIADDPVRVHRDMVLAVTDPTSLIPAHDPVVVVPRLLELKLTLNPGAVFGIGAGKRWFFVIFTVVAISFGLWVFATWTRGRDSVAHVALGLLISGGLGNLYDRLQFACVRDFLHPLPNLRFPDWLLGGRDVWPYVSNIADLYLIIGIGMLMVTIWRSDAAERSRADAEKAESTEPAAEAKDG